MRASTSIASRPNSRTTQSNAIFSATAATLDGVARGEDLRERALPELALEAGTSRGACPGAGRPATPA